MINEIPSINPAKPVSALPDTQPPSEERHLQLPVDKIVKATVAEGGQDRVLLELGNRRFVAETRTPLQTGDKLNLLVTATTPRVELQIVQDPLRGRLGHSLYLLNNSWDIQAMAQQLLQSTVADRMSPAARRAMLAWTGVQNSLIEGNGGLTLKNLAQMMGIDIEARLLAGKNASPETLKSALIEARTLAAPPQGSLAEEIGSRVQLLELFQLLQLKLEQQNTFILPLPLPFLEQGYLLAEKRNPESGEEGKAPLLVSLHLALEKMGNIQVDFLHDSNGLFVRFSSDSEKTTAFAAQHQEELREMLSDLPLRGISFAVGAESPARTIMKTMMAKGDSMFDARV